MEWNLINNKLNFYFNESMKSYILGKIDHINLPQICSSTINDQFKSRQIEAKKYAVKKYLELSNKNIKNNMLKFKESFDKETILNHLTTITETEMFNFG